MKQTVSSDNKTNKSSSMQQPSRQVMMRNDKDKGHANQPGFEVQPKLAAISHAVLASFGRRNHSINLAGIQGISVALALAAANPAMAATFTVSNNNDSGMGSLRQAVLSANVNPGVDDIIFGSLSGSIVLTSGQLDITDSVNIQGPGAQVLAVDGNHSSQIFSIVAGEVSISDLTLTGGDAPYPNGGAINLLSPDSASFDGPVGLRLEDSIISGNTSAVGIDQYSAGTGQLTELPIVVQYSTISDNSRSAVIIQRLSELSTLPSSINISVEDSVISGNSGAGVFVYSDFISNTAIHLSITKSSIAENLGIGVYMVQGIYGNTLFPLSISDSTFYGNSSAGVALRNIWPQAVISNCSVSDNGSGIYVNRATADLQDSAVSGNTHAGLRMESFYYRGYGAAAFDVKGSVISGNGAGIVLERGHDWLGLQDSVISGNSGNGIQVIETGPEGTADVRIQNSTISGNGASGIDIAYYYSNTVSMQIHNSTIFGNYSNTKGGGIFNQGTSDNHPPHLISLSNTIIAGNTAAMGDPDISGEFDVEFTLIGDEGTATINETVSGSNIIGQAPVLGPLQDNGGPTETHALLPGSPSINSGDPNFTPPPDFDQRGPGFPRVANGRIDIGAFESGSMPAVPAMLARLGDINSDGSEDIAVLAGDTTSQTYTATIKDIEDGSLIHEISFSAGLIPVDLEVMVDVNANGAPEIIVLGQAQGTIQAEVRDALSGALLGSVGFDIATPVELKTVPDQDGNGIDELAVLGDNPAQVELRDALTGNQINMVNYTDNMVPKALLVLPDTNDKDGPEIGVLGEHDNPAKNDRLELRDILSGRWVRNLFYGRLSVHQAELIPDLNNNTSPEVAVLRTSNSSVNVLIKDVLNKAQLGNIGFDKNYVTAKLRVLPDVNGNSSSDITVFGKNPNNLTQKAQVKDVERKTLIRSVFFNKNFEPVDLVVVPDINGNGAPEIAMLGVRPDTGVTRLFIKDARTGALLGTVDF